MLTVPLSKNFYYYHSIGSQVLSGLSKKVFSGDNYFGRRSYYKAILNQYVNFSNYTNILNSTLNLNSIPSTIDIQPALLGADIKSILLKYGKPVFVFNENKITIFIYKWKLNKLKTRCEIHFYNKTAFLVNYNYNQLNSNEKDYIIRTIAHKYTGTDGEIDIRNCKLMDRKNNMLGVTDFLEGLKVTYLSSKESEWHSGLTSDINKKKERLNHKARLEEKLFYNNI